jgi:hypothetical protein
MKIDPEQDSSLICELYQMLALADQVSRAAKGTAERVEENVGSERDGPKMGQSGQGRVQISPRQVSNGGGKPRRLPLGHDSHLSVSRLHLGEEIT